MRGVRKLDDGKYIARYFAGYGLDGRRIYPSKQFPTEVAAVEWYLERRQRIKTNPAALTDLPDRWSEKVYCSTRSNAKTRKIPFNLSREDIQYLMERSGGRCEVSRIQFEFQPIVSKSKRRPFAPSLDRIDPNGGYSRDNCRLVCVLVNLAMSDWGMEPLMRVACALAARESDVIKKERFESAMRVISHNQSQEHAKC